MKKLLPNSEKIKISGHIGSWYVIQVYHFQGRFLYLLESEQYGDEAPCLWVDEKCNIVLDYVWNDVLDLEEAFN